MESLLQGSEIELILGGEDPGTYQRSVQQALSWQPDVVHIHRPGLASPQTGSLLRKLKSAPRRASSAPAGVMETNVFGRVDYSRDSECIDVHLQLSKWCLWRWTRWAGLQRSQPFSVVLPNLVMHEEFQPASRQAREELRRQHGIPSRALVFGRIGSRIPSKWSDSIFAAFDRYLAVNPEAWLLLVGLPDSLKRTIENLPDATRARITVIEYLHGAEALNAAYSAMDVFLHASQIGESFGMVLAEAALCGIPAITLSTPARDNSQIEVVGHEAGGLVVANVSGMVEAMRQLEDARRRATYAEHAARQIKSKFGPDVLIPQALEIARLAAAGLSRAELRRRVLEIPGLTANVSSREIDALRRHCLGDYRWLDLAQMWLVTHPLVYRAYLSMLRRSA
jgi:glycosyltransferase involved in cell wall biosynthesis